MKVLVSEVKYGGKPCLKRWRKGVLNGFFCSWQVSGEVLVGFLWCWSSFWWFWEASKLWCSFRYRYHQIRMCETDAADFLPLLIFLPLLVYTSYDHIEPPNRFLVQGLREPSEISSSRHLQSAPRSFWNLTTWILGESRFAIEKERVITSNHLEQLRM